MIYFIYIHRFKIIRRAAQIWFKAFIRIKIKETSELFNVTTSDLYFTDVMCYTGTPWQYQGQVSVTVSGRTCQRWDTNTPHQILETYLQYFQGNTLSEASNHCRNPAAGSDNPWCYTTDPLVTWEYCAVIPC
jgi:integrin beta 3